MEHAKHIIRAMLLLVMMAVGFVLVRHFAYPKSFGAYGHYRYDSVAEYAGQVPLHGAPGACDECHDEQAEAIGDGKHVTVSCEVCHGPLGHHIEGDQWVEAMPVKRSNTLCALCHEHLVARRKDFPQVVFAAHVIERGAKMAEAVCLECHNAHNPIE